MKFQIRINPLALSDIMDIKAYIAEENARSALQWGKAIYSRIEELADFPEMGTSLSTKIDIKTDYRFLCCGGYLIFYRIEGEFVSVYRVLNGVRNYLHILFAEELSEE